MSAPRLLVSGAQAEIGHEAIEPEQRVPGETEATAGARTAAVLPGALGGLEIGLWEMSTGTMADVEADEVFVVLCGSATISGEGFELAIGPGDVVQLPAGLATVWRVSTPLRKVYLTGA